MELTPCQSTFPTLTDSSSRQECTSLNASRTQVAAASQEQHLEMELVTAEGDRVTLSLESRTRALAVGYTELQAGSGSISLNQGGLFAGEQERSMNLTVEGDLNEQEKKDLRSVFKALKNMMGHFVNDRLEPVMTKAKQLGNLDTVAGLAVEMSYSRQVLVAEHAQITATYNQLGTLESPAQSHSPTERLPRLEDNWQAMHQEAEELTNAMAEQLKQVQTFIEQMQESIRDMFDRFRDQAAAWNPAEPAGPELISKMHEDLMAHALLQEFQPQQSDD
jgi:hypothetical protein